MVDQETWGRLVSLVNSVREMLASSRVILARVGSVCNIALRVPRSLASIPALVYTAFMAIDVR